MIRAWLVPLVCLPLATLPAQKTIASLSGTLMRYHGDTIWLERDTTLTRTITRGDTVETVQMTNGALQSRMTYVVHGQSATLIAGENARGPMPANAIGRNTPASVVTFLNQMLEIEIRNADNLARLSSGPMGQRMTPPVSPETPATYSVSERERLQQHRDTVRYIRGCPAAHPDTTLFLLVGADSVKRLSPPERMFGQAMVLSLTSKMRMSMMKDFTNDFQAPLPADLPKAPGGCSK